MKKKAQVQLSVVSHKVWAANRAASDVLILHGSMACVFESRTAARTEIGADVKGRPREWFENLRREEEKIKKASSGQEVVGGSLGFSGNPFGSWLVSSKKSMSLRATGKGALQTATVLGWPALTRYLDGLTELGFLKFEGEGVDILVGPTAT